VNVLALSIAGLAAVMAVGTLFLVAGYLAMGGLKALNWSVLTQGPTPMGTSGGGLRNAIVGTLVLISAASCIGVPIGVLAGIYQIETQNRFAIALRFLADVLNSIPAIVIGLFVYSVVVIPVAAAHPGQGFSAMAGAIALSIIMIPIVMSATQASLRMVPKPLIEGSLALGATRSATMFRVVLPAARAGLVTGIMLAVARVAGETAPLLFTAFGNLGFNVRLDKPIDSLPMTIFNYASSPYDYLHSQAMAGSILLVGLIFILSLAARMVIRAPRTSEP
jgi:phosphate transport system permease protein